MINRRAFDQAEAAHIRAELHYDPTTFCLDCGRSFGGFIVRADGPPAAVDRGRALHFCTRCRAEREGAK